MTVAYSAGIGIRRASAFVGDADVEDVLGRQLSDLELEGIETVSDVEELLKAGARLVSHAAGGSWSRSVVWSRWD